MSKKESAGAIWKKQTSKGEILSITIDGKRYVAWPNTFKKSAKEPDFRIYVDDYKPQAQGVQQPGSDLPF